MGKFGRGIDSRLIEKIKGTELFETKILPDIRNNAGDNYVFPAIRENRIDFYYYNSLLFEFDGRYKTNYKFAFVPKEYKPTYVYEDDYEDDKIADVADFVHGYKNIKERAKLYASPEAIGVYNICKKGNVFNTSNDDFIVLDIEIAFPELQDDEVQDEEVEGTLCQIENNGKKNKRKHNRIDILLYNIKEQKLLFVEAKHFTNSEIKTGEKPPVVDQILEYNNLIREHSKDIISVYKKYVENTNSLLDVTLPIPNDIFLECGLVIFGFDNDQKYGKLKKEIETKLNEYNIKFYSLGDSKGIKPSTIYNKIVK